MIKIIDGDLFSTDAKFICHQVNCMGKMGSGVALQVRQKYPHVYDEYVKIASQDMLGRVQRVPINPEYIGYDSGSLSVPSPSQWICNLFAQLGYGYDGKQYTSNEALRSCLRELHYITCRKNKDNHAKIALPYNIGCCRGGSNWSDVYKIIEEELWNNDVEIWRLDKG